MCLNSLPSHIAFLTLSGCAEIEFSFGRVDRRECLKFRAVKWSDHPPIDQKTHVFDNTHLAAECLEIRSGESHLVGVTCCIERLRKQFNCLLGLLLLCCCLPC